MTHEPWAGRTKGVAVWANGEPYCTVVCTRGHVRRSIDLIKWDAAWVPSGRGDLYVMGWRMYTLGWRPEPPGSSAEPKPGPVWKWRPSAEPKPGPVWKWRLRCLTCGFDVALSQASLDKLARGLHQAGVSRLDLVTLAARVGDTK